MIFGRKKNKGDAQQSADSPLSPESPETLESPERDEEDLEQEVADAPEVDDEDADPAEDVDGDDDVDDDEAEDDEEDEDEDEGDEPEGPALVDDSLREDGPFDIDEVDLEADDVERLDFGCIVITPFDGMQLQLQVDQATNAVQSALVVREQSALELALFAAPARTSMVDEIVRDVSVGTEEAGGEVVVGEGPFGVDMRRIVPVTDEDGQSGYHISRTWYAQGPRWLLRGTLVGAAALEDGFEHADGELLLEVFRNVVVRRGNEPMVPGDLVPMTLPESMTEGLGGGEGADEPAEEQE